MSHVLETTNLDKRFGGVIAVNKVNLHVDNSEMVALIGPNGAGKSTCFNVLQGQLQPDGGKVTLFGRDITGHTPQQIWKYGVGRTFQITATFFSMTVLENIQIGLISHHRRELSLTSRASSRYKDRAMSLLERVGMADQAERSCDILAYGDLKRVELAIALANDPKLLLMDEPTAGMAPTERIELMQLVSDIVQEKKISVLFTEHDMDVVFEHADRILVLARGEIISEGSPEEVRNDKKVQEIYLGEADE